MNYLLPMQDIMSMHCSANVGEKVMSLYSLDYQALVKQPFQLIRTKTYGDDEHGWNKMVYLTLKVDAMPKQSTSLKEKEPQIYDAIKYGTILENTVVKRMVQ